MKHGKKWAERLMVLATEFSEYEERDILGCNISKFPQELLLLAYDILADCRIEGE